MFYTDPRRTALAKILVDKTIGIDAQLDAIEHHFRERRKGEIEYLLRHGQRGFVIEKSRENNVLDALAMQHDKLIRAIRDHNEKSKEATNYSRSLLPTANNYSDHLLWKEWITSPLATLVKKTIRRLLFIRGLDI